VSSLKGSDDGQVRRCLRAEAGGLGIGESDSQDDVRSPQNRDAEPIKRSPNLKAVYL
jgi:hypothetical protein